MCFLELICPPQGTYCLYSLLLVYSGKLLVTVFKPCVQRWAVWWSKPVLRLCPCAKAALTGVQLGVLSTFNAATCVAASEVHHNRVPTGPWNPGPGKFFENGHKKVQSLKALEYFFGGWMITTVKVSFISPRQLVCLNVRWFRRAYADL